MPQTQHPNKSFQANSKKPQAIKNDPSSQHNLFAKGKSRKLIDTSMLVNQSLANIFNQDSQTPTNTKKSEMLQLQNKSN